MDPNQIAAMLASGDKNKVQEAQRALQAMGYPVKPDGKLGKETSDAVASLRADRAKEQSNQVAISENQRVANDPTRNAIKGATEIGPYATGAAIGAYAGHKGAQGLDKLDAKMANATERMAANPNVAGEIAQSQMGRGNLARNLRTVGQFAAPAALLGSAEYIRSHVAPQFQDEETKKWINLGANADQGAGLGMLAHQLYDLKNRIGSPNDPEAEAVIRTRAADERAIAQGKSPLSRALMAKTIDAEALPPTDTKALPAPNAELPPATAEEPAAPTKSATPGTKAYMQQQARDLKIKGYSTMDKPTLAQALADSMAEHGSKRTRAPSGGGKAAILGPAVAAGTAYLAGSDPAEAADGSVPPQSLAEKVAPPAIAAGTAYGTSKLINALGTAGKAAGGMMEPIAGMGIDPMEGANREDTQRKIDVSRGDLSYNMPTLASMLGIPRTEGQGFGITQDPANLPAPSPMRPQPGNQAYPLSSQNGPMAAESLPPPQTPQTAEMPSEPPPDAQQGPHMDPGIQARIQRMLALGAPPQAVAAMLNQVASR